MVSLNNICYYNKKEFFTNMGNMAIYYTIYISFRIHSASNNNNNNNCTSKLFWN